MNQEGKQDQPAHTTEAIVVERVFPVPPQNLWRVITDKEKMKDWYFDLEEFRAEPGFEFEFEAGAEEKKWLHRCRVIEAIPCQLLSYSWTYAGYEGHSIVSFKLTEAGGGTKLTLTHSGVETFPQEIKELRKENFREGWNMIINNGLATYLNRSKAE